MSRDPAVLLISPGIVRWADMDYGLPHLVALGGYLREHYGVRVEILDLNYEGGDQHKLLRTVEELGPHLLIGISCYSSFDYMRVMSVARFLKARHPDVPFVTGGYHASALPEDVVFEGSPFDAVVTGEGELAMGQIVERLLGGAGLDRAIWESGVVEDLDALPPYAWDLLARYWPRATDLGRKLQIYLARGCPYHCTFCMERAKSGYSWRAYSPERAVDELARLASFTDLSHWIVNVADPLFGFKRSWRRQVLRGIIDRQLFPRQYWTLTRSDDLEDEDVELLAHARFSIGIGLESGSPDMLVTMQKGNRPDRYLDAMRRLARLSLKHDLNWATNVIVGHPGETMESMEQTRGYLTELFTSAKETCGWLSIDPFRLYPGAHVHEAMATYSQVHGTVFHHPRWWHSWYDGPFRAEHIDPSRTVDYATRLKFMHAAYAPLVHEIGHRFRGQGRSVDRVFARSIAEQIKLLSPEMQETLLERSRRARVNPPREDRPALAFPLGFNLKDEWIRRREDAVRSLLEAGVLRTHDLIEVLLQVGPERFMSGDDALEVLSGRVPLPPEGSLPPGPSIRTLAMGLEALEPVLGDRIANVTATSGYVTEILRMLVGDGGEVLEATDPDRLDLPGPFDGIWICAALPRTPARLRQLLVDPDGRAIVCLGPRFRPQDLASLTRHGDRLHERVIARVRVPILAGRDGWIQHPGPTRARERRATP